MAQDIDLRAHENIVFFTGAGMSAQSGVPTYRGKGGIWKEYDWESCACQDAFERDPEHVWEFHNYRRELVGKCEPNDGHDLIAQLGREYEARPSGSLSVVTQNIDGLHQAAGSQGVLELHGSLWRTRCEGCGARQEDREAPVANPRCECGRYRRPDIVWFGDSLFEHVIREALRTLERCDLLVSIGTSAVVFPAAEMPLVAKRAGAKLVEINPEPTPLSDEYDICLRGGASEILTELCARD